MSDPQALIAEADDEILITLKEFGHLFNRTSSGLSRAATAGRLWGAVKIANEWHVLISARIVRAARRSKSV